MQDPSIKIIPVYDQSW